MSEQDRRIPIWKPTQTGETLIGTILKRGVTRYQNGYYVIQGDQHQASGFITNNTTVMVFGTKLLDELMTGIEQGSFVTIKYLGLNPMFGADGKALVGKDGSIYRRHEWVVVEGRVDPQTKLAERG